MKQRLLRSMQIALAIGAVLGLLHWWGVGLWMLMVVACVVAYVAWTLPFVGVRWLDAAITWVRGLYWAADQGRFHSFGGFALQIEDDGRHVWIDGPGLQRVLGRREPDDAQAARHSGAWRRTEQGVLMLRVDAVVQHLARMPGRDEPRIQKLRLYLERDVLYPAARRRDTR